ncbi:MAG: tetrahydrodipicolinate N-succinyltransferase N-terminal domain-containing protein, partial [Pseudonocardiales bacterium]
MSRRAWGYGLASAVADGASTGRVLDTWFPAPALGETPDSQPPHELAPLTGTRDGDRGVRVDVVLCEIDLDEPPADVSDVYLRLHLLSHRLVAPRGLNLDGIFGLLPNVVWTSMGPCQVDDFEQTRMSLRRKGPVQILGIDKFPRMTDYVVPTGVRIADADRV